MLIKIKKKFAEFRKFNKAIELFSVIKLFYFRRFANKLFNIKIKKIGGCVYLRSKSSDIETFEQIFIRNDYDLNLNFTPKIIIDAGAYIGLSSIYFNYKFKNSKIIAIEPAKNNYNLLKKNTEKLSNIHTINAAIWHENKSLILNDDDLGEWGYFVTEGDSDEADSVKGITIDEIMKLNNLEEIDILKLDIEGSEYELFSNAYEKWLGKVKVLIIELHEGLRPGCTKIFIDATSKYHFDYSKRGENEILIQINT